MSEFAGRVAMVTGAGSGIGEATARLFAAANSGSGLNLTSAQRGARETKPIVACWS